ncbi:hypothetical protein BC629DRAFT_1462059 [Irpex lacteus]|nr:hypothetical protein BC629DRAFT_1462059 [Irpex lacteus]
MSDESAGVFKFGPASGSDVESNAVSAMLTVATIVLCLYDHSLTLSREVKGFWKQRLSISSWLYFVNRYVTMICSILLTVRLATWTPQPPRLADQICNIASTLTGVCKITIHLVFALFASIRTYAIWGKNMKILVCVLLLGLVYPAGYAYYTACTTSSAAPPPLLGCLEYTNTPIKPICVDAELACADCTCNRLPWDRKYGII